jgi:predicted AAA+ superfamily ATPase
MIPRSLSIKDNLKAGKVLILYGARQVGKTTLVKEFLSKTELKYRYDTGDNFQVADQLSKCTYQSTQDHVGNNELIIIDEAQKIANIGTALKLMVDINPNLYVIATGSSSFELANMTNESLTGRKKVYQLFPIAQQELAAIYAPSELKNNKQEFMVYGSYPEVVTLDDREEKIELVREITYSYLIKDILEFDKIRNSEKIYKLLQLLAFQIGSEVSANELAQSVGIDVKTIQRYLDLLKKSYVIFDLNAYSSNPRKEISKGSKYYFYDLGIRNALIGNFNLLDQRNDVGAMWENFMIIERIKRDAYMKKYKNYYFWRTYTQKEVDFIEEYDGKIVAYEFKFNPQITQAPKAWHDSYPDTQYYTIHTDNYLEFITGS